MLFVSSFGGVMRPARRRLQGPFVRSWPPFHFLGGLTLRWHVDTRGETLRLVGPDQRCSYVAVANRHSLRASALPRRASAFNGLFKGAPRVESKKKQGILF